MRKNMKLIAVLTAAAGLATAQHGAGRAVGHAPAGARSAPAMKGTKTPGAPQNITASAHLLSNPAQAAQVAPLLPTGMTAEQAAAGFRNWGQFVSALQVSKNLGIPFTELRSRMTQEDALSLGKAVHQLRPDLPENQVRSAVKGAEREAKRLQQSGIQAAPVSPAP